MFDSLDSPSLVRARDTVVVAMSGGVDSSLVAAYLRVSGYSVVGITLRLYDSGGSSSNTKTCCAGKDIADAQKVARDFDFPHYVIDYRSEFQSSVIQKFINTYEQGETPIPCIDCNQTVKFRDLLKVADSIGATALATGHYVRRKIEESGEVNLYQALDVSKDQSYFMFTLEKEKLGLLRFPLGVLKKSETRQLAERIGVNCAQKPDSQDICFVNGRSYKEFIRANSNKRIKGYIIDTSGKILATHEGIADYTVGQRRGININSKEPTYVVAIDGQNNNIVVGSKTDLLSREVLLRDLNWLGDRECLYNGSRVPVSIKLRSGHSPISGIFKNDEADGPTVLLDNMTPRVCPGQACVMYGESGVLIGGGWIMKKPILSATCNYQDTLANKAT